MHCARGKIPTAVHLEPRVTPAFFGCHKHLLRLRKREPLETMPHPAVIRLKRYHWWPYPQPVRHHSLAFEELSGIRP